MRSVVVGTKNSKVTRFKGPACEAIVSKLKAYLNNRTVITSSW